ncbi:MAG: porin family protein [Bacteroidota bacterium]
MKTYRIILFTAVTLISLSIYSQNDIKRPLGLNGLAGLNVSSITGDDVGDIDSRISFSLGLGLDVPLGNRWSLAPEIIYSRQGFKSDLVVTDLGSSDPFLNILEENVDILQDYLLIPVKFHFRPIEKLYVFAGPQMGILVNDSVNTNIENLEFPEETAPVYFSGLVGAGIQLFKKIAVQASYQFGLSRVYNDIRVNFNSSFVDSTSQTEKIKAYHSVINVSLVYSFKKRS